MYHHPTTPIEYVALDVDVYEEGYERGHDRIRRRGRYVEVRGRIYYVYVMIESDGFYGHGEGRRLYGIMIEDELYI